MYRATTQGIQITVEPMYLEEQSEPKNGRFVWAYTIEIRNLSATPVQLRRRHWIITDAMGRVEEVEGAGVIGEQPVILPGEAFEYTSGCPLPTPSGIMEGSYSMELPDGRMFSAEIPAFSLDTPSMRRILN
ncbi:Co2+/Mg2+ efflux protein ApaG [Pannonibacter sp.]|uniref:Co2+/Mg2+ efflux protein ApaG n=1 Tax=Pannonibacter sp. TaxID=1906786 RepID=UPI0039551A61